jgi:hypothetical protein
MRSLPRIMLVVTVMLALSCAPAVLRQMLAQEGGSQSDTSAKQDKPVVEDEKTGAREGDNANPRQESKEADKPVTLDEVIVTASRSQE